MTALSIVRRAEPERQVGPRFMRAAGDPAWGYYALVPETSLSGAQPLVLVHGISRNAIEMVLRFAPLARRHGIPLIAPLFPKAGFGTYQQVVDRRSGVRADEALFAILGDAADRLDVGAGRFSLFGFSGGGQFAHRFTLFHPERVSVCIPVSAGWYTFPDPAIAWPLGLKDSPLRPADRDLVAAVPFHVVVGNRDRNDDEALRRRPKLDRLQGTHRVQRARRWYRAMRRSGIHPDSSLTLLARTRHDFAQAGRNGLTDLVFSVLGKPNRDRDVP